MEFHLTKQKKGIKHKKDGRINPHRFWILFLSIFIMVLTVEIIAFTYFFVETSHSLDAPVLALPDTNINAIKKIESTIKKTEDAVSARVGLPASQNPAPIVQ